MLWMCVLVHWHPQLHLNAMNQNKTRGRRKSQHAKSTSKHGNEAALQLHIHSYRGLPLQTPYSLPLASIPTTQTSVYRWRLCTSQTVFLCRRPCFVWFPGPHLPRGHFFPYMPLRAALCQDSPYLQNSSFFGAIRPHILLKGKGNWALSFNEQKMEEKETDACRFVYWRIIWALASQQCINKCELVRLVGCVTVLVTIFSLLNFDHCMHQSVNLTFFFGSFRELSWTEAFHELLSLSLELAFHFKRWTDTKKCIYF